MKSAKIELRKGDGVNPLEWILGDKLISHCIAVKSKKDNHQYQKILILAIAHQRNPT